MGAASGGVRRLAGFAAAVVAGAQFLVLDEPTNDVDPVRRQLMWNLLTEMRRGGDDGAAGDAQSWRRRSGCWIGSY